MPEQANLCQYETPLLLGAYVSPDQLLCLSVHALHRSPQPHEIQVGVSRLVAWCVEPPDPPEPFPVGSLKLVATIRHRLELPRGAIR
jgi:hypothetical protein